MNLFDCPNCGTHLSLALSVTENPSPPKPRIGRPPKPKTGPPPHIEANTISTAFWLSLGGPAGFQKAHELPGSTWPSKDVYGRYHHWATRFGRPLMNPASFGRAMRRFGITGTRTGASRFFVFPDAPLDLSRWLVERCPFESEITHRVTTFDPEDLPWVQGLRKMVAAEPDEPRWVELLEALPRRNYADPLDPFPEWLIPYDAPSGGLGSDSLAAGGPAPAPSPSVECVIGPEPVEDVLGPETAAGRFSVFARSTRADWPSS